MWLRLQIDIGFREISRGLVGALFPGKHSQIQKKLESFWSDGQDDALAALSVRSSFDLLLQALNLPEGSEVLFTAITLRDMTYIAEAHGLVPVPVDVTGSDFQIDLTSLRTAISPKSKVLVIAHLFGAIPDLQEVLNIAREHDLYVIEDCAQAWFNKDWRGTPGTDASLFSFGAIKTATAAGGALCRVRDPHILERMRTVQNQEPIQSNRRFSLKLLQFSCLKIISYPILFGLLVRFWQWRGKNFEDLLSKLLRGFPPDNLLERIRQQPSKGLLRFLHYRQANYDGNRIQRRIKNAQQIMIQLNLFRLQSELDTTQHSFWLFPYLTDRPVELIQHLRQHGFDTTQRGRMIVVAPPDDRPECTCPQ
ncbi:MAG: aminotransferase class I/II-fold pyridoxal phosphate-dependent enzyme, partial [Planctomycetaceae bacterium]|nr:aminotransferase class I/II-fold pyridoxal phosphate-dependent enzyme [Planctomycetaceae bacterium]